MTRTRSRSARSSSRRTTAGPCWKPVWPASFAICPPIRPRQTEVVVVDDASTDGTFNWVATHYPRVRLVHRPRNGGFCAAANAGLNAARGHFIQLLNNDTEVTAGWLEAGLAPFADPTVGSVAPLVLLRSDPARVDSAGDSYTLGGWPSKRGHGEPASLWIDRPREDVFAASGSSAFYRAGAIRQVGGFDPLLGSYYEDVDLGFRLRWAGYRSVFESRCRILHEISATYDHAHPALQRRIARNAELVFWSNLPAPARRRCDSSLGTPGHSGRLAAGTAQVYPFLPRQDRRRAQHPQHSHSPQAPRRPGQALHRPGPLPVQAGFLARRTQSPAPSPRALGSQARAGSSVISRPEDPRRRKQVWSRPRQSIGRRSQCCLEQKPTTAGSRPRIFCEVFH